MEERRAIDWIDGRIRVIELSRHSWQLKTIPPGTTDEATISLQKSLYDPGYVNAMSHFYRGELGRIMVWRQRLDITTNWAITSSTAIITIAFSNREVPHIIFFFNLAIVWGMLWIEARRYRFYDAFRARVRMLEAHFLVPMVMENREMLQGEWKKLVCEDLILPSFKISKAGSGRAAAETQLRFHFHPHHGGVGDEDFPPRPHGHRWASRRSTGPCASAIFRPGSWPSSSSATFASVIGITIYVGKKTTGEVSEFRTHRSLWKI